MVQTATSPLAPAPLVPFLDGFVMGSHVGKCSRHSGQSCVLGYKKKRIEMPATPGALAGA